MSLTRRCALLAAAGLTLGLSGCLSQSLSTTARTYDRAQGTYERGPRQGRADSLTVDETVVVDDPDLDYLPGKNAVRFPSLMNQDGVVAYDTTPFGRWSQSQCAEAGVEAVWAVVSDRVDDAHHIGRGATSSFPGMVVELSHDTELDENGDVVVTPPLSFEGLLDVTPESVTVSVSLDGETATHTVPVNVIGGSYNPHTDGISAGPEIVYNETAQPETATRAPETGPGRAPAITADSPAVIHHSGVSFDGGEMTLRSWAEDECIDVALDAAQTVVDERLGETSGVVWGTTADGIEVQLSRSTDQNGTVVSTPTHSVAAVLDATPYAVNVPIAVDGDDEKLAGRNATFTVPVRVQTRVSTASWT